MNEADIIQLFYPGRSIRHFDDCCILPATHKGTLHSTDSIVEGTHFKLNWSTPESLAVKILHCNISDIISSGGLPEFAFLNLGIPEYIGDSFLQKFASSLIKELGQHNIELAGGDTFRSTSLIITLHLTGVLPESDTHSSAITRSGGRPGQMLYLTGDLGRSLLGYRLLSKHKIKSNKDLDIINLTQSEKDCIDRHLAPRARTDLFETITGDYQPSAMMDISDGLLQDAIRLANASEISLHINLDKIPVHPSVLHILDLKDSLVSGEELELMFLSDRSNTIKPVKDIYCIGNTTAFDGEAVSYFHNEQIIQDLPEGYSHW